LNSSLSALQIDSQPHLLKCIKNPTEKANK